MKVIHPDGTILWHNPPGDVHRENSPALLTPDGRSAWCLQGHLSRSNNDTLLSPNRFPASSIFVSYFNIRSIHGILVDARDAQELRDRFKRKGLALSPREYDPGET
jgi:hypothetical protein